MTAIDPIEFGPVDNLLEPQGNKIIAIMGNITHNMVMESEQRKLQVLDWIGSSYRDFMEFPSEVTAAFGYGLYLAQIGERHVSAKTLKVLAAVSNS